MSKYNFTTNDLMNELDIIGNYSKLNKFLKFHGFKGINEDIDIKKKLADKILYEIRRKKIDWYKYKKQDKDLKSFQIINDIDEAKPIKELITKFSHKLKINNIRVNSNNRLLGLITEGGFLKSLKQPYFDIQIKNGINSYIGDRGSGKSTNLQLLSLLSSSIAEETNIFIKIILSQLNDENYNNLNELHIKVRRTLKKYNIKKYGLFFLKDKCIYCYFINIDTFSYDLFILENNLWVSVANKLNVTQVIPSMQIFHQSEIVKIVDDNKKYYLNNILDLINKELFTKRQLLVKEINKLGKQYKNYKENNIITYTRVDIYNIKKYINNKNQELNRLYILLEQDRIEPVIEQISRYLNIYDISKYQSLLYLIKGDQKDFNYLYIEPIYEFLKITIKKLKQLQLNKKKLFEYKENNIDSINDFEEIETFINHYLALEKRIDNRTILRIKEVQTFLKERLKVINNFVNIYKEERMIYNKELESLLRQYLLIKEYRSKLINMQSIKCNELNNLVRKDISDINIFSNERNNNKELKILYEEFYKLKKQFTFINNANSRSNFEELQKFSRNYDNTTHSYLNEIIKIVNNNDYRSELIFSNIRVTLKQGKIRRDFSKLSYGQRSGIILKIALETTKKDIIILDQPEDNMDATSIIKLLIPTFNRISKNKQLLIATHSSSLVMGLKGNIVLMSSRGEYGTVKKQGTLNNNYIIQNMINILEGGIDIFGERIEMYDRFIRRLGNVTNLEIESSFRKRTIDSLRNSLEPIINDKSILDTLRHELGNVNLIENKNTIENISINIKNVDYIKTNRIKDIFNNMNNLSIELQNHISKIMKDIEKIRAIDINPKEETFSLNSIFNEVINDNIKHKIENDEVKIEVSAKLKGKIVKADKKHIEIIFQNLFNNSLRATEKRADEKLDKNEEFTQKITINLEKINKREITLIFVDNGFGMPSDIEKKLYIEPCSDRASRGTDHGMGGTIIGQLLGLNSGRIEIIYTTQSGKNIGTKQRITLKNGA